MREIESLIEAYLIAERQLVAAVEDLGYVIGAALIFTGGASAA